MHVITKKRLGEFWENHNAAEKPLKAWFRIAKSEDWQHLEDVRKFFPHCDRVGSCCVFNIAGNKYRLITKIYFMNGTLLVRAVLTHSEYDEEKWKTGCK